MAHKEVASRVRTRYAAGRSRPGGTSGARYEQQQWCTDAFAESTSRHCVPPELGGGNAPRNQRSASIPRVKGSLGFSAVVVAVVVAVLGLAGSMLTGTVPDVPIAHALCGWAHSCANDPTATSALEVSHIYEVPPDHTSSLPVEPDDGETWNITATWSSDTRAVPGCSCKDLLNVAVNATVTWTDGSGWSVTCNGCNANGPIRSVSVCNEGSCGSQTDLDNGWSYKLIVDIDHTLLALPCPVPGPTANGYLSKVVYTTTSVDDGNVVDVATCTEGSSVTPTSQTWTQTDTGTFECGFGCSASGPTLSILYE